MRGGSLVREARERVGLTQAALADRAGTTQSAIARIENGSEPTLARLEALLAACGISMHVHLSRFEPLDEEAARSGPWRPTDPLLSLLRHRVPFVVAGRAAAALHGVAVRVDVPMVVPDVTEAALERLAAALDDLRARRRVPGDPDGGTLPLERTAAALRSQRRWELETSEGPLDVDFEPAGTRGFVDLARRAEIRADIRAEIRAEIPGGLVVASAADAARHLDAAGDDLAMIARLRALAE